tara:strand:- start:87 stop:260 length:174 start_codon:yes stop_codon:yes gene_type:complete
MTKNHQKYANSSNNIQGEVTEWSIVTVSKTVVPSGTVGSNPTLSAILKQFLNYPKEN